MEETYTTVESISDQTIPDLKEGTHIGRYQILGLIGKGGMGAVYKAYDPELDRSIAIKMLKVMPHEGETVSKPRTRLMREAQALAKLSHPNVVSIFDVGTHEQSVYIAMEYIKGKNFRQWIREEKPTQKEILEVLIDAGKGLQAAHSEGIVHRDFKPDNTIVGDRGQVKVLDFGLARSAVFDEPDHENEQTESLIESSSEKSLLSAPLTRLGAMVGTPVYMAPEHFQGQKLDEQTDQFSFCVTLFEALYGKRPFPGKTMKEFEENLTCGWIEIPQDANVPKWIEDIIQKGLSLKKDDRYKSITDLLDALSYDPEIARRKRRKKIQSAILILLLTATTFGFGHYALFKNSEVCTGASRKVAELWDKEKKEKINQAFANTGLSFANYSFVRVTKRFDDYLDKWKKAFTDTCEATRIRGEQSEEIMDLKMGCLNEKLINAAALIRVLGKADKTVVEKSVQAVSSLSSLSTCNNVKTLQSKIPLPTDEQTKQKVAAIREKLADVEALRNTGKYREGLELARNMQAQANFVNYRPVLAEALYWLGILLEETGEYKEANTTLHKAAGLAGEIGDGLLTAKIMSWLVWIVGYKQAQPTEGLSIAQYAEIIVGLSRADDDTRASLFNNIGMVLMFQGSYDKSLEYNLRSLSIREKEKGIEHPNIAASLSNIGMLYAFQGEYTKALESFQKSLAIEEPELGPDHPTVAKSLANLGNVHLLIGEHDRALEYFQRAHPSFERALGPNHPHVAQSMHNIGSVYLNKGEFEKAIEYCHKALAIWEKTLGSDHPYVADSYCIIGEALLAQGKWKQALEPLERLSRICKKKTCEPESNGQGLFGLAQALLATGGNKQRAIKLAKESKEIFLKQPEHFKEHLEEVDGWLKKQTQ